MKKKLIKTPLAPQAIGPYSQAVQVAGILYTSGQIALDPQSGELIGTDIRSQSIRVMENLKALLTASNSSLDNVIKTTCFLTDMGHFTAFNEVYTRYFSPGAEPARSCVAVQTLPRNVLIEVEALALVDQ